MSRASSSGNPNIAWSTTNTTGHDALYGGLLRVPNIVTRLGEEARAATAFSDRAVTLWCSKRPDAAARIAALWSRALSPAFA